MADVWKSGRPTEPGPAATPHGVDGIPEGAVPRNAGAVFQRAGRIIGHVAACQRLAGCASGFSAAVFPKGRRRVRILARDLLLSGYRAGFVSATGSRKN